MLALAFLRRQPEALATGLAQRGWSADHIAATLAAIHASCNDDAALTDLALHLPNLPAADVPPERVIIATWGDGLTPLPQKWRGGQGGEAVTASHDDHLPLSHQAQSLSPSVGGQPLVRPHWDILTAYGWWDAPAGKRIAGPGFPLLRGWGARLERALQSFMLDLHVTQHGYTESAPPLVASAATLFQTGHLPHFTAGMYPLADDTDADALWLNPTAEVPLVALHAGDILTPRRLPLRYVAGIASFRREAGSPGRQTRGLLRRHQFQKVELIHVAAPEAATASYDAITAHATAVLAALNLPYRVVELPAPELSFAAERGRDIEVWFPGVGEWIEVSSISDCGAFQARRANIRIAASRAGPRRFAHTLNGSGLAVGRTLAALLENAQTPEGISIPPALRPYLGGAERIPE